MWRAANERRQYRPRRCGRCPIVFTPTSGNQKWCAECSVLARQDYFRTYNRRFPNRTAESMSVSATNRIDCPRDRAHRPRMIHERHFGVTTGRMIAWCFDCSRVIPPNATTLVTISEAERTGQPAGRRKAEAPPDEDTRARNAAIRLAWANESNSQVELALKYGLTTARVGQIIHGRRRSA